MGHGWDVDKLLEFSFHPLVSPLLLPFGSSPLSASESGSYSATDYYVYYSVDADVDISSED